MEDFKKLPKMQCFKTGGVVNAMCAGGKSYKEGRHVESEDIKQDKAVVKKAIAMHDKQEHPGEKTDLSKLKKGGRSKKEAGTVKHYKTGGLAVDNKPGKEDPIKKVKVKEKKAAAPSKAAVLPPAKGVVDAFKKGGKVKKYADGSLVGQGAISDYERDLLSGLSTVPGQASVSQTEKARLANRAKNRAMLSPLQQRELDAQEAAAAAAAPGLMKRKKGGKACR